MVELGLALALSVSGVGVLSVLHGRLPRLALAALSFPTGAGVFLLVALGQLVVRGTVFPRSALLITIILAVVGFSASAVRRSIGVDTLLIGGIVVLATVIVVAVSVTQHLTRLTPDSLDHLMISVDLRSPEAMSEIRPEDMMKRQVGLAMLHSLSDLTDRQYLSFVSPMFGVSAFGLFAWFLWSRGRRLVLRDQWVAVALAGAFLASSNRMIFHGAYINVHMAVALLLLAAIVASWLALVDDEPAWAPVAGVALALTLLFRPEAPLLMALMMVPVAASSAGWRQRWWLIGPAIGVLVPWYALLWRHAPGGSDVSLTAPVFGNIAAVVVASALVVAGGAERAAPLARLADRAMIPALAALLAAYAVVDPSILGTSLWVTAVNMGPDFTFRYSPGGSGLWMHATWLAAIGLVTVAILVERIPWSRIWKAPIIGFGLLYFLLPYLRGSPWRVGYGDSGSRIVAHILLVMVVFVVLAIVERGQAVDEDRPGLPSDLPSGVAR